MIGNLPISINTIMLYETEQDSESEITQECVNSTSEEDPKQDNTEIMPCEDVKSIAVVKYSSIELPAHFTQLQRNFNLNEAPANWLHGGSKWENYLQEVSLSKDKPFSSFKMAHCYPDLTGEIDVISDAENIKKLLKIPYSKKQVSMMVHRVENTLLLDEFDVHKHLLRNQQDEWKWLRKFYYETILQNMKEENKDNVVLKKNKSRDHLQSRNMFSKFLYYSGAGNERLEKSFSSPKTTGVNNKVNTSGAIPDPLQQPRPDQTEHQRTVQWTFEDIRMLIGTDLPIFGSGTHPCVSLKLRDMSKPINVLTGLDYWLDNLMCTVPELAMCYHLNGIVQKYELLKTDDIPNMAGCGFSTKVVTDVAQNILSFLRSNATEEGHTYWLFKGHNDDFVKLYDLTTLCSDVREEPGCNPFTVPVGILLYRVARNMRQNLGRKKSGTIQTLLKNSILLLDERVHSQVVTSAHYFLSDLYVSDDVFNPDLYFSSDESDAEDEQGPPDTQVERDHIPVDGESSVDVQSLCQQSTKYKESSKTLLRYPPVSGCLEQRCREALKHIASGLSCLDQHAREQTSTSKHKVDEQAACDPDQVIPLHYASISPSMNKQKSDNEEDETLQNQLSVFTRTSSFLPYGTWHTLSKTLLLRKTAVVYYGLANNNVKDLKYDAVRTLSPSKAEENEHVHSSLLGLAGDVHLMLSHLTDSLDVHRLDSEQLSDEDNVISESALADVKNYDYNWVTEICVHAQDHLKKSVLLYELALDVISQIQAPAQLVTSLKKRYGNANNELGVFYMNQASQIIKYLPEGKTKPLKEVTDIIDQSCTCLEKGIKTFEFLGDIINIALLTSNKGRLMRLMAQAHAGYLENGQREFGVEEKHHYNKAVDNYQMALHILEHREKCLEIWDSISWELSSTYFTMATLLQDYAPLSTTSKEVVEKEVTNFMMKALKYCDCDNSPRQTMCQYRAATIHHRLASLYHNSYRNQLSDQKKKHLRTLADIHYGKACALFTLLESPCENLRILLERFAMSEYHLNHQTSPTTRIRMLQTALTYLLDCISPLHLICQQLYEDCKSDSEEYQGYHAETKKLLPILQSRLEFTLMNLVKNSTTVKKSKSSSTPGNQKDLYKEMYSTLLKRTDPKMVQCDLLTRCQHLLPTLKLIADQYKAGNKAK